MNLRSMTLKELEDLRFTLECEILERTGFSQTSFDSFDTSSIYFGMRDSRKDRF